MKRDGHCQGVEQVSVKLPRFYCLENTDAVIARNKKCSVTGYQQKPGQITGRGRRKSQQLARAPLSAERSEREIEKGKKKRKRE